MSLNKRETQLKRNRTEKEKTRIERENEFYYIHSIVLQDCYAIYIRALVTAKRALIIIVNLFHLTDNL
jgi:hypothetical protein